MTIMTHAKFHFSRLMVTLIFGIWASEPHPFRRRTEKAWPDRVNCGNDNSAVQLEVNIQLPANNTESSYSEK